MASICMYFQVHQPHRLDKFTFFDMGGGKDYFSKERNKKIFERVAKKCYYPANETIKELIYENDGRFSVSYSITGTFIDQCEQYDPNVLESFIELYKTGHVDLLDETYYHSLAYLVSDAEFREQVKEHRKKIKEVFGHKPKIFRNTEAMYCNSLAKTVEDMGYEGIIAEGWDKHLGWRSPNYLYRPKGCDKIKLMMRNYRLSDDVAFRFSTHDWNEFPLTADKYAKWLSQNEGQVINLFMDYETFGEHQWHETGIFGFLKHLPRETLAYENLDFATTSEAISRHGAVDEIDVVDFSSWADVDRDLSAWLGNKMQNKAFEIVKSLENNIKEAGDEGLLRAWRMLQTSDHLYYMCTKWFADGDIHKYFNDYETPYDAFANYMNVLSDLKERISRVEDPSCPDGA